MNRKWCRRQRRPWGNNKAAVAGCVPLSLASKIGVVRHSSGRVRAERTVDFFNRDRVIGA